MQTFNTLLESGSVADIDAQLKSTKNKVDELKFALSNVEETGTQGKATKLRLGRDLEKANEELTKLQTALDAAEARQLTNEFNIQFAFMNHSKSYKIRPHLHFKKKLNYVKASLRVREKISSWI